MAQPQPDVKQKTKAQQYAGWSICLLRLFIAWIFIRGGLGKLYGYFGGSTISPFAGYLSTLGIAYPQFMAYVVAWSELICGGLLAVGLFTRLASIPIIAIMVVAIIKVHPTDFNYPAVVLLSALVFVQYGSGKLSLDGVIHFLRQK